jgi:hypothetical protein
MVLPPLGDYPKLLKALLTETALTNRVALSDRQGLRPSTL